MSCICVSLQHNTFQTILLTDGVRSYSVFLYNSMNWGDGATIGFSDGTNFYTLEGGEGVFATSSNVLNLPTLTNVGTPGVFIFSTESCKPSCTTGRLISITVHFCHVCYTQH